MKWSSSSGLRIAFNGGVVVFSKWPIKEQHQYIFKYYCGKDGYVRSFIFFFYYSWLMTGRYPNTFICTCNHDRTIFSCRLANKGFAQVILDYKGTNLHVYGTHMQSDDEDCGNGEAAKVRARNVEYWRSYIDDTKVPANELIILAGDFNIEKNTTEFYSFLTNFQVDQPVSYQGHPHTLDTDDNSIAKYNKGPSEYLDYVFLDKKHRAGVKSLTQNVLRVKTNSFQLGAGSYDDYSDHYPVHALIEVDLQK